MGKIKHSVRLRAFAQLFAWSFLCSGVCLTTLGATTALGRVYESFADVITGTTAGVVNIRTTAYTKERETTLDPYLFFLGKTSAAGAASNALGSGVIIDPKGFIVTNLHVIQGATTIEVLFAKNKKKVVATLVGSDILSDLALLKINPPFKLRALDFGDSDALRVGDVVLALGNPFGLAYTANSGIISAKGGVIGTGPLDNFLQTDVSIHPGNSGGPLIDLRGRLIGINTAAKIQGGEVGYAVPSNLVKEIVKQIKTHGKVIRPWLGIVGKNVISADEISDGKDPVGIFGVIIENLIYDSPAHQAGLQIGDLIIKMDDTAINDLNDLTRQLSHKSPRQTLTLKIYRRNKGYSDIKISIAEAPKTADLPVENNLF